MKKAVIFDIDGVLADKSPDRGFREYDKVDLDTPIKQGFELCEMYLLSGYEILFVTGRKNLCRDKTIDFLFNNLPKSNKKFFEEFNKRISFHPEAKVIYVNRLSFDDFSKYLKSSISDSLFMREDNDHRPAEILKKEIYDNHIKDKYDVVAVFEDDKANCRMWKQEGLFVFQVGTRDDFGL